MIRNASDLTPAERAALETLLGRRVRDGESVSLRTFVQANVPEQERVEIVNELKSTLLKSIPLADSRPTGSKSKRSWKRCEAFVQTTVRIREDCFRHVDPRAPNASGS